MSEPMLQQAAHRFALMGDPTRLLILSTLLERGESSVNTLVAITGVSRTNLSQHLARMSLAGLVGRRRLGNQAYYRITDDSLPRLCDLVCESVRERAAALGA